MRHGVPLPIEHPSLGEQVRLKVAQHFILLYLRPHAHFVAFPQPLYDEILQFCGVLWETFHKLFRFLRNSCLLIYHTVSFKVLLQWSLETYVKIQIKSCKGEPPLTSWLPISPIPLTLGITTRCSLTSVCVFMCMCNGMAEAGNSSKIHDLTH